MIYENKLWQRVFGSQSNHWTNFNQWTPYTKKQLKILYFAVKNQMTVLIHALPGTLKTGTQKMKTLHIWFFENKCFMNSWIKYNTSYVSNILRKLRIAYLGRLCFPTPGHSPGPWSQFVFIDPGPKFVFTVPGPKFAFTSPS